MYVTYIQDIYKFLLYQRPKVHLNLILYLFNEDCQQPMAMSGFPLVHLVQCCSKSWSCTVCYAKSWSCTVLCQKLVMYSVMPTVGYVQCCAKSQSLTVLCKSRSCTVLYQMSVMYNVVPTVSY